MTKILTFALTTFLSTFAFSESTPLEVLSNDFHEINSYSKAIGKWNCAKFKDEASVISCNFLKALYSHKNSKFEKAQEYNSSLIQSLYKNSNFALMGMDRHQIKKMIHAQIKMYGSAFEDVELGGLNGISIDSIILGVLQGGHQHNNPYGKSLYISNVIDVLYEERKVKSIKQLYGKLGLNLADWLSISSGEIQNSTYAYRSILSKLVLGDETKAQHINLIASLWSNVSNEQRVNNLDVLIDLYIKSSKEIISSSTLESAISKLDSSSSDVSDIKVRLYLIALGSLVGSIPETLRMPQTNDYSKVLIRYYHLLNEQQQKQFKTQLIAATREVLNKRASKTSIDELVVANHVMYRDLLGVAEQKDPYYRVMYSKYSVLMKDYMDYTDQSSKSYSAVMSFGALSRVPLGEGLM